MIATPRVSLVSEKMETLFVAGAPWKTGLTGFQMGFSQPVLPVFVSPDAVVSLSVRQYGCLTVWDPAQSSPQLIPPSSMSENSRYVEWESAKIVYM